MQGGSNPVRGLHACQSVGSRPLLFRLSGNDVLKIKRKKNCSNLVFLYLAVDYKNVFYFAVFIGHVINIFVFLSRLPATSLPFVMLNWLRMTTSLFSG